jgi:hypothetical protein
MNKWHKNVISYQVLLMMIFGVILRDALATDVSIDINTNSAIDVAGQQVSVHPDLFGINFPYYITDDQRLKLVPLLKGKVRFLRWPEGAITSSYSYAHPCSQSIYSDPRRAYVFDGMDVRGLVDASGVDASLEVKSSDECVGEKGIYFTDIYEFIEFCNEIGAEPMVGIPLQTGFWGKPNSSDPSICYKFNPVTNNNDQVQNTWVWNDQSWLP